MKGVCPLKMNIDTQNLDNLKGTILLPNPMIFAIKLGPGPKHRSTLESLKRLVGLPTANQDFTNSQGIYITPSTLKHPCLGAFQAADPQGQTQPTYCDF